MDIQNRKIYVVLSDTGALTAKILKRITKAKYNHVSLSLKDDLSEMYSFGRRWKYWAFFGGFMKESLRWGLFSRFPKTQVAVFPFEVSQTQYHAICSSIEKMYADRKRYKYNWWGLFLVLFHKKANRKRHYFCSEFVKKVLVDFGIEKEENFPYVTTPNDFLALYGGGKTYEGELRAYAPPDLLSEQQAV